MRLGSQREPVKNTLNRRMLFRCKENNEFDMECLRTVLSNFMDGIGRNGAQLGISGRVLKIFTDEFDRKRASFKGRKRV